MSSQELSYLRFSLEETVWFASGQQVGELYSISLDPQVQTEEDKGFVRMHGFLELSGEYAPSKEAGEAAPRQTGQKQVQQVLQRDNSECEFFHQFPVDITIPKSRITKMEDVEIYIDSFDYEFPEKPQLKLTVDLSISGVIEEEGEKKEAQNRVPEAENKNISEEESNKENEEPPFSILKLEDIPMPAPEEEQTDFSIELKKTPQEPVQEQRKEPAFGKPEEAEERGEPAEESSPSSESDTPILENESPEIVPEVILEEVEEAEDNENMDLIESPADQLEEVQENQENQEKQEKKKKSFQLKKMESMSLADFFARRGQERSVTWKVCLVQKDDTLQSVAERYNLSVTDILRENQLDPSGGLEEGQALYIPVNE
ncbi:stage VI sporulation protein D [Bacillus thermotolerans]|uniref:stage VI sporulation protein D n=1 Tax=Bacillus thermotolerans TaxID=1221996 RepID=UPI0005892A81|nr:stage VI sporulation protein D [Bacillus thermotolerans]KKB43484.1 Stage VI sporulation protein D [Bacillus thermotolerans]